MAKVKIQGNASGTGVITLIAPNTNTDRTVTLPDESITLGGGVDGIVSTANATAITIDSSENVGIGTATPGYTSGQQPGTFQTIYSSDTNGGILELASNKNTDNNTLGIISFVNTENSNSGATTRVYNAQIRGRIDTSDTNAGDDSGGVLEFQTKAEAGPLDVSMTIASDGNVGVGKVPETWDANWVALEVGQRTTLASYTGGGGATLFKHNAYGGFTSKYQETAGATGMYMDDENIKFEYATSGTADTAITWVTSLQLKNDGRGLSQFTASVWCNYNGQTNTINTSHNISSITDNGLGTHTMNFTNSLSGSKYPVALSGIDWGNYYLVGLQGDQKSGSSCKCVFDIFNSLGGSFQDPEEATFIAYGDGT